MLTSPPVLAYPDFQLPFELLTYTSNDPLLSTTVYKENTRWVPFDIKFTRQGFNWEPLLTSRGLQRDIKFKRQGFENACWHRKACRDIEITRWVSFDIKFTRQGFVLSCVCYVFVCVCLYVLCGHLLGKGWPLGSHLWCLLWVYRFPIGILGQVWYLIVSIPDLCTLTYFENACWHREACREISRLTGKALRTHIDITRYRDY